MRDEEEAAQRALGSSSPSLIPAASSPAARPASRKARLSSFILHPSSFISRYAPVVVWVGFIFFASTGSFSASNTSRIVRPLLLWLFPDITEASLLAAHMSVRKAAHFAEYAVLALVAARAFLSSPRAGVRALWAVFSFALVAACALLDEYHQSFLATRFGTFYDSLIDVAGGACALALVAAWRARRARRAGRAARAGA